MRERIYKYPLETTDHQVVVMPKGATPLCVQMQEDRPCLWARVDPGAATEAVGVYTVGTGHMLPRDLGLYLGTYQMLGGSLVWHVYTRRAE